MSVARFRVHHYPCGVVVFVVLISFITLANCARTQTKRNSPKCFTLHWKIIMENKPNEFNRHWKIKRMPGSEMDMCMMCVCVYVYVCFFSVHFFFFLYFCLSAELFGSANFRLYSTAFYDVIEWFGWINAFAIVFVYVYMTLGLQ